MKKDGYLVIYVRRTNNEGGWRAAVMRSSENAKVIEFYASTAEEALKGLAEKIK